MPMHGLRRPPTRTIDSIVSHLLPQILIPLTAGSLGLLILLTAGLVCERVARNRRERAAWLRRQAFAAVLASKDPAEIQRLGDAAASSYSARGDLVDAVQLAGWTSGTVFEGHVALYRAAADDVEHRDVSRRAVGAALLGVIGGEQSIELLQFLMREDSDSELRLIAARALRVIGGDAAAWALIRGLRDHVMPIDRILEQLGRPFAAPALLLAMQIADFNEVRADIADGLGLAAFAPAAHALGGLVRFGSERERTKACRALGRLGDPIVVPLLARAMEDEAWVVRAQAATALGACGVPEAVGPLARALADQNWWVRANSASGLRRCGVAGRGALRHAATNHPDRYARDRALEALALEAASTSQERIAA
jgi:HEAT repeat protein